MNSPESQDKEQNEYYDREWSSHKLSTKPGRSGWRTSVPAPDFLQFNEWLKGQKITGKALDLGCGAGRHSIVLAQSGFEVYGIDFAESATEMAKEAAAKAGVSQNTHFQAGNVLSLPYEDSFFDVANDDGCLHHIDPQDWQTYTEVIRRVIKSDGVLRVKAFSKNCDYFKQNSPIGSQWVKLEDSGYTYFFSERDIRQLFSQWFEVVRLEEKAHTQASDKKFFFVVLRLV
jgi:ubiquinone/menaquinone biosynthesis C-methylase UbiE